MVCSRIWIPREWLDYFRSNKDAFSDINWSDPVILSSGKILTIQASLQEFQLGESSDGSYLITCAQAYALQTGDSEYLECIHYFIKEEQRHASSLARFMNLTNIPKMSCSRLDGIFRYLRHLGGLEISINILLAAEIVALVYYAALRESTPSLLLRSLCDHILNDEYAHWKFHIAFLLSIRSSRSWLFITALRIFQYFFYTGTLLIVWIKFYRVFREGNYTATTFWKTCMQNIKKTIEAIA